MVAEVRARTAYIFAGFRLDPLRRTLYHGDSKLTLRPTPFEVLLYLVEHAGELVEKEQLLETVWKGRLVEESNLGQTIFWLRAELKTHGGEGAQDLIQTVRGRGYRFVADVVREEPTNGETSESSGSTPPVGGVAPQNNVVKKSSPHLAAVFLFAATAAVVVLSFVSWRLLRPLPRLDAGNTVVLADFDNRSREPIFDRTLQTVLRVDLSQSPYLTVLSDKQSQDILGQMMRKPGEVLTGQLAQEVCTRANANAVLSSVLDKVGPRYVLTISAISCSGQNEIAAEKAEVTDRADVVPALDRLIANLRGKLGEPLASVNRFNVPMLPERTASLEALKAYSEGVWLNEHGHREEAEPAFRYAVQLDPNFAGPYVNLAVIYGGTNQDKLAADAIAKAYALRDTLNERQKMNLRVLYNELNTKDMNEATRILRALTAVYPDDYKAWGNLANIDNVLGRYDQAIFAASQAVSLHPQYGQPYTVLARAELRSGRPDIARQIGADATKLGFGSGAMHGIVLAAEFMQHDRAAYEAEVASAHGKPGERELLVIEAQVAFEQGRIRLGNMLFDRCAELAAQQGLPDPYRAYRARLLIDLNLTEQARALLKAVNDTDDDDLIFAEAEVGSATRAAVLIDHPQGTLIQNDFAPEVHAALALRRGDPAGAIVALEPAIPYQSRTFDIPYVLGRAYLAAGDGAKAAASFKLIRDHQGWYPESPLYALSQLQLARALVRSGDKSGARFNYREFLDSWRSADSDAPLLLQARAELAELDLRANSAHH